MKNKKRTLIMILSTVFTVILAISFTYAFFYYGKEGSTITLESGSISLKLEEDGNFLTLHDTYPKSDNIGMISTNYYDFTVSGSKGKYDDILYEIQIEQMEDNTLAEEYVKVYLTDQKDSRITSNNLINFPTSEYNKNRVVYSDYINSENQEEDYRLRVWVDKKYTKNIQETFNFKLVLYAINTEEVKTLYENVEESLTSYFINSNYTDEYDAKFFVSGSKDDENLKNYVWYSGKLWRIIALNNNGTLKMITANPITVGAFGSELYYEFDENNNVETKSWVYQWLNEDFLDTLYNSKELLAEDYMWDISYSQGRYYPTTKELLVPGKVGLMNTFEFNRICNNNDNCYLYKNNYWYLSNRFRSSSGSIQGYYYVYQTGISSGGLSGDLTSDRGIVPCIVLDKNVKISPDSGDGSKENPFMIIGDINKVNTNENLNNRISGEYVRFDGELYRIIGNVENKTKLVKDDVLKHNGETIKKTFASTKIFGLSFSDSNDQYWNYFLNNTWYNNISNSDVKYQDMIVEGKWYLPEVKSNFYKTAICDETSGEVKISICKKSKDVAYLKVGLSRYGEMFTGPNESANYWLINQSQYSNYQQAKYVLSTGYTQHGRIPDSVFAVRPSFYLSEDVYITGGLGTKESPFEIAI